MSLYLLDTDILTLAEHGHSRVSQQFTLHPPPDVIGVSIVNIEEQWNGWYAQLRQAKTHQQAARTYGRMTNMLNYVRRFELLPFLEPSMQRFDSLKRLKLGVGGMDLRIAAIALEQGAIVVTRNKTDFQRIPGLTFEDWSV